MRTARVVAQVTLALMVRSFRELRAVDPGFEPEGVLTFRLSPPTDHYEDPESVARFYDGPMDRLVALPGITAAGAIDNLPLTGGARFSRRSSRTFPSWRVSCCQSSMSGGRPLATSRPWEYPSPGTARSRATTTASALAPSDQRVDQRPVLAGGQCAGQAHGLGRVVGIVGNGHQTALKVHREQFVYLPILDSVSGSVHAMTVAVRSDGDPLALMPAFRGVIQGMDADLPVSEARSMDAVIGASVAGRA